MYQDGDPNIVDNPKLRDNCYAIAADLFPVVGASRKIQSTAAKRIEDGVPTFTRYMKVARELKPTFLLVNQWNQFEQVDEGFDYMTTHSIEPALYAKALILGTLQSGEGRN